MSGGEMRPVGCLPQHVLHVIRHPVRRCFVFFSQSPVGRSFTGQVVQRVYSLLCYKALILVR